jgi:hypothetical protein
MSFVRLACGGFTGDQKADPHSPQSRASRGTTVLQSGHVKTWWPCRNCPHEHEASSSEHTVLHDGQRTWPWAGCEGDSSRYSARDRRISAYCASSSRSRSSTEARNCFGIPRARGAKRTAAPSQRGVALVGAKHVSVRPLIGIPSPGIGLSPACGSMRIRIYSVGAAKIPGCTPRRASFPVEVLGTFSSPVQSMRRPAPPTALVDGGETAQKTSHNMWAWRK